MTDLAPPARLYVLGFCRNNERTAEAVARVVFQRHPIRRVAEESGMARATLFDIAKEVRAGLAWMIEARMIRPADLVVRDA